MNTFTDRIGALESFVTYDREYHRGVAAALADARLFFGRGEARSGEHFLLVAELRAGVVDADTFAADDPTGPWWAWLSIRRASSGRTRSVNWSSGTAGGAAVRRGAGAEAPAAGTRAIRGSYGTSGPPGRRQTSIALSILVPTGVLDASAPRPTGSFSLDGRIGGASCVLEADTFGELLALYQGRGTA